MSKKVPDLTGETFGRWTVLQYAGRSEKGDIQYKCQCACGTVKIIRRTSLTSGNSKSCGCLKCLAKLFVDYTSMLYDGEYIPSDEAVGKITQELLWQLQQPYESPTGQKG